MIPLIRNGKTLDFITALSDAISCVRSVKADGDVDTLTLTYPVMSQGANYIKCFNIIEFEYADGRTVVNYDRELRWYVITKVARKDLIMTATAEELVRFMMRRSYSTPTYSYDETKLSGKISSLTVWDVIQYNWGHNTYPPRLRFHVHPDQESEDIASTANWVVSDYITMMDALSGKENSLCDIYDRQLKTAFTYSTTYLNGYGFMYFGIFDLVKNKNTHLKWKKEIKSYTLETNAANVVTQVTSYYSDLHGPGIAPTSPYSVSYGGPVLGNDWFVEDLSARRDATNDYERRPTEAQFTSISSKYLRDHRNPTQRITIEVGDMRGVEIALHEILNIWLPGSTEAIQSKVTDYEYDELRERYTKLGLGAPRRSFARAVARDVSPKLYQT